MGCWEMFGEGVETEESVGKVGRRKSCTSTSEDFGNCAAAQVQVNMRHTDKCSFSEYILGTCVVDGESCQRR